MPPRAGFGWPRNSATPPPPPPRAAAAAAVGRWARPISSGPSTLRGSTPSSRTICWVGGGSPSSRWRHGGWHRWQRRCRHADVLRRRGAGAFDFGAQRAASRDARDLRVRHGRAARHG